MHPGSREVCFKTFFVNVSVSAHVHVLVDVHLCSGEHVHVSV